MIINFSLSGYLLYLEMSMFNLGEKDHFTLLFCVLWHVFIMHCSKTIKCSASSWWTQCSLFLANGHFMSCFHFHTAVKRTGHTFFDLCLDIKQLCDQFFPFLIFLPPHSHTHIWEQQSSQWWWDTCDDTCIWFLCFNTKQKQMRIIITFCS